ncbi:MAG: aminopeptidase [Gemmatimonadaceae bacterium]
MGAVTGLTVVALLLSPMGCYVSRAAYEEARILARRQPIERLVAHAPTASTTAPDALTTATRAKLQLVAEARRFAIDSLGLTAGNSFTQFSPLDRDTLVLVLSAAYQDRLELKTWWFPVVGRFPYKGFFDFAEAREARTALQAQGFDVTLGPSSAFSTLGWFNDPVVSTTIRQDSVTLVNTVLHELLHTTYFAKGRVPFNESFASFVGGRGAEAFFRAKGDTLRERIARDDWHDDLLLGAFWAGLSTELETAFAAHPDSARTARIAARTAVYAAARRRLVDSIGPALRRYPPGWTARVPLDNAVLLARRVYADGLDAFDQVYAARGARLRDAIATIISQATAQSAPGSPR